MTPADIRTAFPQFADQTDGVINAAIAAAAPFFEAPARYGDFLADAQGNCVAHFIVMRQPDVGTTPGTNDATSEDRASLKVTRDASLLQRQAVDPFMRTSYGQMYCYYRDRAGLGGAAAVVSQAAVSALWPPAPWGMV